MKSLLLALLVATPAVVVAQGSLTPAAAPAPTQRTLTQLAPRVPLGVPRQPNTSTLVITKPGSYVLMGNVTVPGGDAIQIRADNVTLDLNGFRLNSTAAVAEGCGIRLGGAGTTAHRAVVRNGAIHCLYSAGGSTPIVFTGGGFLHGIAPDNDAACSGVRVEDMFVGGGGAGTVPGHGIDAGPDSTVAECIVRVYAGDGIRATTVIDCISNWNGGAGIRATTVLRCYSQSFGNTAAIFGDTVTASVGHGYNSDGIVSTGTVTDSFGNTDTGEAGIRATAATRCFGAGLGGSIGIKVSGTATFCQGSTITATTAIGCSGTVTATTQHLMPAP